MIIKLNDMYYEIKNLIYTKNVQSYFRIVQRRHFFTYNFLFNRCLDTGTWRLIFITSYYLQNLMIF